MVCHVLKKISSFNLFKIVFFIVPSLLCVIDLGEEHMQLITSKNRGSIDKNGWLHSGDKGQRDVDGMLKITGRYKELIIGAGGENVAPVSLQHSRAIQVMKEQLLFSLFSFFFFFC